MPIHSFTYFDSEVEGKLKSGENGTRTQHDLTDNEWKNVVQNFNTVRYLFRTFNYAYNVKWITYKIYRVDPLTRENISESAVFGEDKPLKQVVYGASGDLLKSRLQLTKLGINYQPGEMYRIVVSIDEYMNYGKDNKAMPTASCESSIVFTCYDTDEKTTKTITDSNGVTRVVEVPDYTPLQWASNPAPDSYASVELANGQAGLVDSASRKIFDVYYQWYLVGENGADDEMIAGMTNIYKGDKSGLQYRSVKYFSPDNDGFTYLNTIDPKDPLKDTYNTNGLPFDKNTWTGKMIHSYLDLDTPDDDLKKTKELELSLQNNNSFVTGRDSCYIPASYEGRKIYCKAIAVNTLWPKNYDHVQVFYSHPMTVRKSTLNAPFAVYSGDYATKDNPVKLRLSELPELGTGEYVNKVVYHCLYDDTECTIDNISAVSLEKIKTVNYPQDFEGASTSRAIRNGRIDTHVYTNKGKVYTADKAFFIYEIPATDITINYSKSYFYNNVYHASSDWAVESFGLKTVPSNATVGYSFAEGASFTSSDPDVASIDARGELVLGGKTGKTVITVTTPKNTTKSITVCVPIKHVSVSGISAPKVGEILDVSAALPQNPPYTIQEIYWTEGKSSSAEKLPSGSKAKAYTSYTAHVVLSAKGTNKFMSDSDGIKQPYSLTAELADGSKDTVNGTLYDTTEITYYFPASADGNSNVIDTIMIECPDEVKEGTSISEWKDNIRLVCNASDIITPEYTMTYGSDYSNVLSPLGYTNTDKIGVFISGFQDGFQTEIEIPDNIDVTFAGNLNVLVNGIPASQLSVYGSKHILIGANNSITVIPETKTAVQPKPDYIIRPVRMAVGQTINLSDYIDCNDKSVELKLIDDIGTNNLNVEYDRENNTLKALSATSSKGISFYPYVLCDADNDGVNETMIHEYLTCFVYENVSDIPVFDDVTLDVTILDTNKNVVRTISKTLPYNDNTTSSSKIIELPETEGLFNAYAEYTGNTFYTSGSGLTAGLLTKNSSVTIRTFSADSVTVTPFAREAKISRSTLLVSVDGVHWYKTDNITGLTPATKYTLYYKQDKKGLIYTKEFTTASKDYGFTFGDMKVTNLNNGTLEKDGWHYDESTNTLTLKDCTLETRGSKTGTYSIGASSFPKTSGALVFDNDININLVGNNTITKLTNSNAAYEDVIYCGGNVTFTGDGTLTLVHTGSSLMGDGCGIRCAKNIYLKNTGNITINKAHAGFMCENGGTVYYYNGELDFNGLTSNDSYKLIGQNTAFSLENKFHTLKAYTSENDDVQIAESEIVTKAKQNKTLIHIIPQHDCTLEVQKPEYLISSDKENGNVYYKSCSCGHTDRQTSFTVPYVETLKNTSTISSKSITLGKTVTVKCSANGGQTPYKFAVYYKLSTASKWTTAQSYKENTTVKFTPKHSGKYNVSVKVKSANDTIIKKSFTVTVTDVLKNNTAISAKKINKGDSVTVTCAASGGKSPYTYAVYYKLSTSSSWTTAQSYKENTVVKFTPKNTGAYDVSVKVKDADGTIVKKAFTVTVTDALKNNTSISSEKINKGDSVTVTCGASGGKAPYTYAVYYKLSTSSGWTTSTVLQGQQGCQVHTKECRCL